MAYRGYKTELELNNKQITACRKAMGSSRFIYNWGLAKEKKSLNDQEGFLSFFDLRKEMNKIKDAEFPWLREVSCRIIYTALDDLDRSFSRFFADKKRGFPRFRKRRQGSGSFRVEGLIKVLNNKIQLPRLGVLNLKEPGYIPVNVKFISATVSTKAGRWFVSVLAEEERPKFKGKKDKHHTVGVDLGIKTLATVSDGQTFENPRALQKRLRKLRRLNQSLARKQKGSQNRKKAVGKLQKLYWRISNVRKNVLHSITTCLAKTKRCVVIEDLNVKGMTKNRKLARAIADVGFYEFKRQLLYKAEQYNCKVVIVDRFFPSSKTCSCCGQICDYLTLDIRKWKCLKCKTIHDRDLNAAKNLEKVAVRSTETKNACGEKSSDLTGLSSVPILDEARIKLKVEKSL